MQPNCHTHKNTEAWRTSQIKKGPGRTKSKFLEMWGGNRGGGGEVDSNGYIEHFQCYRPGSLEEVVNTLSKSYDTSKTCMEIGCGAGFWTRRYLSPNFKEVVALDLLDNPMYKGQPLPENVRYIELPDRDYNCTGVEDESIDFAFSFGVFCHLPNSANETYVNSIYKKLKVGGVALLAFADFYRHFLYSAELWDGEETWLEDKELQDKYREELWHHTSWHWNDMNTINDILLRSPFRRYENVTPLELRDCLVKLTKNKNNILYI